MSTLTRKDEVDHAQAKQHKGDTRATYRHAATSWICILSVVGGVWGRKVPGKGYSASSALPSCVGGDGGCCEVRARDDCDRALAPQRSTILGGKSAVVSQRPQPA